MLRDSGARSLPSDLRAASPTRLTSSSPIQGSMSYGGSRSGSCYRVPMQSTGNTASCTPWLARRCRCHGYMRCAKDAAIIGSAFYVMEFLDGRVFWDQRLPRLAPADRRAMFDSMNAVIAGLHSVDHIAVGLEGFGRPGNYMARQIGRWSKQYQASETEPQPVMDALIEWLSRHLPPEEAPRIVHCDYRMDNLVFHKTEPRAIGVLDWELSTIGDPLADFAYHVMTWRVTPELFRGLSGIDFASLGIPTEDEYVAAYCRRTGRGPIPGWDFYIVYSLFRLAAIMQGIAKRAIEGTAASDEAVELGRRARPVGEQAWALARSLGA